MGEKRCIMVRASNSARPFLEGVCNIDALYKIRFDNISAAVECLQVNGFEDHEIAQCQFIPIIVEED